MTNEQFKELLQSIDQARQLHKNEPYRCPVCLGCGNVPAGFYSIGIALISSSPEICRSCRGTGIIWSKRHLTLQEEHFADQFSDKKVRCPTCEGTGLSDILEKGDK